MMNIDTPQPHRLLYTLLPPVNFLGTIYTRHGAGPGPFSLLLSRLTSQTPFLHLLLVAASKKCSSTRCQRAQSSSNCRALRRPEGKKTLLILHEKRRKEW